MNFFRLFLSVALPACLLTLPLSAAPLKDIPSRFEQPDGTVVMLVTSGDEFSRVTTDLKGFTVVRDFATGWLHYADLIDGKLAPTILAAGIDDPAAAGLQPGLRPTLRESRRNPGVRGVARAGDVTPSVGQINNLFVFIRFSDDETMYEESDLYDEKFNSTADGHASMRAFFSEVSMGAVDVRTIFTPPPDGAWMTAWTSPKSRQYYQPYDARSNTQGYSGDMEAQMREHAMLRDALAGIEDLIPPDIDFDANDDGWFDNVIFMIQGWPDGWSDLLWPHKWEFYEAPSVAGLQVGTYNLQLSVLMRVSPGTFAHEMYHSFGAPDLYHYSQDGRVPVGPWDLMEATGMEAAQHPLAYMKWKYGNWIEDIPIVSENSDITLHSSWMNGTQAVRIPVPESDKEYFVVEYRRRLGLFETQLPSSGLIVYRINPDLEGIGNREGPPDEVYVFRPGEGPKTNGSLKDATMKSGGRTVMNDVTDPPLFLKDGTTVELRIYDVGEVGDTISFKVCLVAPGCGELVCGSDGFGGWCGDCPAGNWCLGGACVPCTCDGRDCGDDGCGNSCGTCDDQDQCTTDECVDYKCVFTISDGLACDDGDLCTSDDMCSALGACAGTPYTCSPGRCMSDSTCKGDGTCKPVWAPLGTSCDDNDPCTMNDACNDKKKCVGEQYACLPGPCDSAADCDGTGGCQATFMAVGTPCDDSNPETVDDACTPEGVCAGQVPQTHDVIEDANGNADTVQATDEGEKPVEETAPASGGCSASDGIPGAAWLPLAIALGYLLSSRRRFDRRAR